MPRARILLVSQYGSVASGGAERYIHEVTARLLEHDFIIHSASPDAFGGVSRFSVPWKFFSGGFNPKWIWQCDKLLKVCKPDVLYAHLTVPSFAEIAILRAAASKIPVCLMYHSDVTGPDPLRYLSGAVYRSLIGKKVIACASALCVASDAFRSSSLLLQHYHGETFLAPPGVDPRFSRGRRCVGRPYILFVGKGNLYSKGLDVLYRAWTRLRQEHPDLDLIVAGETNPANYPGIRCLGYIDRVEKLADLYASAEVVAMPSRVPESFGMVLAEALVAGSPIVGSKLGGIPGIIQHDFNGYQCQPGDADDLYDMIRKVITNSDRLRQNIAAEAHSYGRRFSWDHATEVTISALEKSLCQTVRLT